MNKDAVNKISLAKCHRAWIIVLFSMSIAYVFDVITNLPASSYFLPISFCLIIFPTAIVLIYFLLIKKGFASFSDFGLTKNNALKNALIGISLGIASGIAAFITAKTISI